MHGTLAEGELNIAKLQNKNCITVTTTIKCFISIKLALSQITNTREFAAPYLTVWQLYVAQLINSINL